MQRKFARLWSKLYYKYFIPVGSFSSKQWGYVRSLSALGTSVREKMKESKKDRQQKYKPNTHTKNVFYLEWTSVNYFSS